MDAPSGGSFRRLRLLVGCGPVSFLLGTVFLLLEPGGAGVPWLGLLGSVLVLAGGTLWVHAVSAVHRITRSLEILETELGSVRPTVDAADPIPMPESAEVAGLVSAVRAIVEQLQGLARVEAGERRLIETILDAIPAAVVVVGADRRIRRFNEKARSLLGVQRTGVPLESYVRDIKLVHALDAALAAGKASSFEIALSDGERRDLSGVVLALPAAGSGRGPTHEGAVITLHDISHIRRLERARRDLVANVSHELKTPVAIIRGFAETLREGAIQRPEGRDFLRRIEEESERVGLLVDRLLLLARLEQPEFQPRMEPVDCDALLAELVAARRPLARRRGVDLRYQRPPEALVLYADRELLYQAVGNLLDNALRYTPDDGLIEVSAQVSSDGVVIAVKDTGPGIPPEHQSRVFERFYRVHADRARQSGGTGLGLAIVKHVAQVHGGHASVASQPGQGATFRITLPLDRRANPLESHPD